MNRNAFALLAAALIGTAAQAQPEKPGGIWEGCGDDARPSGLSKFMVGPKMAEAYQQRTPPSARIEACTQALAALGADAPWQKRAAFLRSRARAYVANRRANEALADIAAIRAIEQSDPVYARSFGLSLTMLRALALAEKQDFDGAAADAQAALQMRPWSDRIAMFAFRMMSMTPNLAPARTALLDQLIRYDPDLLEARALDRAVARNWQGAARDWQRVKPAPGALGTTYVTLPNVRVTGAPGVPIMGVDEQRAGRAALSLAMAGLPDQAQAILTAARTGLAKPPELPGYLKDLKANLDNGDRGKALDRWSVLVDAATKFRAGHADQALADVQPLDWSRADGVQIAFLVNLQDAAGHVMPGFPNAKAALKLLEDGRLERIREAFDPGALLSELPDHEDGSKTNAYRKQVMFLRASGFKSGPSKSGPGTDLHVFGDKLTSLQVSEMALLRAAELTLAEGKPAFIVTNRSGFRQTMQQTIYGRPIGPVANGGNGVDLTFVAIDPANPPAALKGSEDRVIDANQIRQALDGLYVERTAGK